jgi:DNA-binding IclR family transcriptional regulator
MSARLSRLTATQDTSGTYKLQAIDRAVVLLDLLSRSDAPMSLTTISSQLSLPKSTVQRFLRVLEGHHFVNFNTNGRYTLGLRLNDLGNQALQQFDIRDRARPHFRMLVSDIKETGHLCILQRNVVVYVDKIAPTRSICMTSRIGMTNPIHCTSVGKAMLAFSSNEVRENILANIHYERLTSKTHTTRKALMRDLEMIRRRGYALDDEEIEEGVRCIGAPILDSDGHPLAAISVAGPTFRITTQKVPAIAKRIVSCCASISHSLGYNCPVD